MLASYSFVQDFANTVAATSLCGVFRPVVVIVVVLLVLIFLLLLLLNG